jgi:hypothetical protein
MPSVERRRQARRAGNKIEQVEGRELIDTAGQVARPWRCVSAISGSTSIGSGTARCTLDYLDELGAIDLFEALNRLQPRSATSRRHRVAAPAPASL